ncbi:helix-turn-helix transcriptional regulator [Pseudoalteromonas aurantia]|uniref:XRE family transcriptional regulator n=2 Tax=Pseudoalteromonas TaxID=53246 RepID=A0A5S3V147_9GAMM|nr:helix-turn-helix transcriptional regulator [Pseudoalteromonas aurantia]TMO64037.1 XRE family transcriptional regulator [Pseudoalteromonas aurantia]TMO67437.1 XRE family transcriptional regulator [Pseudoalteromonas aurantia]TMO78736.1 XRE family transcriptional regulator [Pseudoalteromonas aurantia]
MKHNTNRRKIQIDKFKAEMQKTMRSLRKKHGLTQKQLGVILNVDQATISNFESGKTIMSITQVYEMTLIFGSDFASPIMVQLFGNNEIHSAALVA